VCVGSSVSKPVVPHPLPFWKWPLTTPSPRLSLGDQKFQYKLCDWGKSLPLLILIFSAVEWQ
jgi:hypothetical protein